MEVKLDDKAAEAAKRAYMTHLSLVSPYADISVCINAAIRAYLAHLSETPQTER